MAIGARASDWHSSVVHPLRWIAGFICAAVIYVAVLGAVGHIINGD